jgi:predicted nucleotidyltransferase
MERGLIDERRQYTDIRFQSLKSKLQAAEDLCRGKACVYATGSFARGEAHKWSDLDLFIVGQESKGKRDLSRLNEIRVKADLIEMTQAENIPEFSGDGRYLEHYTASHLTKTLGKPEDDAANTFTARLLLLLESKPLLGEDVYDIVLDEVVSAYWQDYVDHKNSFMPAFLANDILRLWRTFCVNYEARTLRQPEEEKAKRKLKNYKLKFSRLLTCYSALLYLLASHAENGTVSTDDAKEMVQLTPTERLEWLLKSPSASAAQAGVTTLLSSYENFLVSTAHSESDMVELFLDKEQARKCFANAAAFGTQIFDVLQTIGNGQPFYRMLVV